MCCSISCMCGGVLRGGLCVTHIVLWIMHQNIYGGMSGCEWDHHTHTHTHIWIQNQRFISGCDIAVTIHLFNKALCNHLAPKPFLVATFKCIHTHTHISTCNHHNRCYIVTYARCFVIENCSIIRYWQVTITYIYMRWWYRYMLQGHLGVWPHTSKSAFPAAPALVPVSIEGIVKLLRLCLCFIEVTGHLGWFMCV